MDRNEEYQRLVSFANNMKDKHPGISNMYILQSIDKDGNVTDTKYGMNLMTNKGFNDIYKSGNTFALSSSVHLYVGQTVQNFDKNTSRLDPDHVLFGGLAATNAKIENGLYVPDTGTIAKDYRFPIMYSIGQTTDTGLITLISRLGFVYYPGNIENYNTDTLITEYGIGTNYDALWTHSHIYNNTGEKSSITKKKGEMLVIYIYTCLSLYEHVIMNNWANGLYIGLTTNEIMFQRMYESNLRTYKRNNIVVNRNTGVQHTLDDTLSEADRQAGIDSIIRNYSTFGEIVVWNQEGNDQGYIDGFIFQAPGCMMINPEYLSASEDIELDGFTSSDMYKPTGFSDRFGLTTTDSSQYSKVKYPPFTTLSDVSVYTFNYHTGDWDCACPFVNNNDTHYTNAGLETNYCIPIYYWSNGQIQTAYLYQNTDPTNPILSVQQGHSFLMATDKYWDQSTWITITDMTNIPVAARNCHYWIAGSNAINIVPTRQTQPFQLLDAPGGTNGYHEYSQSTFNLLREGGMPYADNPGQECAIFGGSICAISRQRSFRFMSDTYEMWNMTYGKWAIVFINSSNTIRTIDMSTLNSNNPDTSVLSVTRTLEFTSNVNAFSETYKTESLNGLICVQSLTSQEAIVLTIGNTITSALYSWIRSCCICNTSLIAYIPTTDTNHIHILDTSTQQDVGTAIELPSGYTPHAIFGNGNHIWFYDGTTTYHVNISSVSRALDVCNNGPSLSFDNTYRLHETCVADVTSVFDGYRSSSTSNTLALIYIIENDAPTNIRNMEAFYQNLYMNRTPACVCQMKYLNNDTLVYQIMLSEHKDYVSPKTANTVYTITCDLGRYLKTGTVYKIYKSEGSSPGSYLYGESIFIKSDYLFPVVNMLPIKLTCKTKTITSFNHSKRITNKQFELGFTNMPTWGYEVNGTGKPPGTPYPELNGNGNIIGWSW